MSSIVSRSYHASFPPPEFERLYLKQNPDIAEAVAIGAFGSGHHHWSLFGREEGRSLGWTKADLINFMASGCGYRTYLEICTLTTGLRYAEIDRSKYQTCRLVYGCPKDFDDGLPIDFRSVDFDIADCVKEIQQRGLRPDVVLVDPFHDYETSARDLQTAIELVANGGTVIVHDCDPPSEAVASPHFIPGTWFGVTYKAYLDRVIARDDLLYCTVDTDYGCGIIRKRREPPEPTSHDRALLVENWRDLGNDFHAAFQFLQTHKAALLKLVSVEDFLRG